MVYGAALFALGLIMWRLSLDLEALADKKRRAALHSVANYGFHFGVSNDNLDIVAALDPREVAGVKVFMGASTGNMLVDDPRILQAGSDVAPYYTNSSQLPVGFTQDPFEALELQDVWERLRSSLAKR